ncbi:glutathione S-transferase [Fusarium oxysporum f. sp. albedinis]|nr:glutathione S-transferase [Fusarium oxysporum f. sp. albedinis]
MRRRKAVHKLLALTALDGLSNERHDVHHPVSMLLYYEDQLGESKRKAQDYTANRIPKFLGYFEKVLKGEASGDGPWLYGGRLTYADLVLFQCLDGVKFAFPKTLASLEGSGKYDSVFTLCQAFKQLPNIKAYLESKRRLKYSNGIYRHYPELDIVSG